MTIEFNNKKFEEELKKAKENQVYVIIKEMSAGNDSVGDMWQETKVFDKDATLDEVMDWALEIDQGLNYGLDYSRRKIIITKPHRNESIKVMKDQNE